MYNILALHWKVDILIIFCSEIKVILKCLCLVWSGLTETWKNLSKKLQRNCEKKMWADGTTDEVKQEKLIVVSSVQFGSLRLSVHSPSSWAFINRLLYWSLISPTVWSLQMALKSEGLETVERYSSDRWASIACSEQMQMLPCLNIQL